MPQAGALLEEPLAVEAAHQARADPVQGLAASVGAPRLAAAAMAYLLHSHTLTDSVSRYTNDGSDVNHSKESFAPGA